MRCPQCGSEQPLWAQYCMQCGARQFRVPDMEAPADAAAPPRTVPVPLPLPGAPEPGPPAPPLIGVHDFRPHITVGYLLALVATLVLPPLFGAIAIALGWLAWSRGSGHQKRQGRWVIVAGVLGTAIGLAIALWVDQAGLLA